MSMAIRFLDVRDAEQRNLALGLCLALLLHLVLTQLPSFGPVVTNVMPALRISLQTPPPKETVQQEEKIAVEPMREPVIPQQQQPTQSPAVANDPEIEPITSAMISKFSLHEADQSLVFDEGKLANFSATFSETASNTTPALRHYQNAYGETHVITKLGDRNVCYQQNSQFVDDDWGFNIVMFYACEQEEKIKLEIP